MNITAGLKFLYHRRFVDGTRCAGASITTGQVTKVVEMAPYHRRFKSYIPITGGDGYFELVATEDAVVV